MGGCWILLGRGQTKGQRMYMPQMARTFRKRCHFRTNNPVKIVFSHLTEPPESAILQDSDIVLVEVYMVQLSELTESSGGHLFIWRKVL